jgi:SAM-dependent methyltransferase
LLSEEKPSAGRLTEFFLFLSLGGAVGGFFNSIIAPLIFKTYAEYPLAMIACCFLRSPLVVSDGKKQPWIYAAPILAAVVSGLVVSLLKLPPGGLRLGIGIGVPLVVTFALMDRVRVFGIGLAASFVAASVFDVAAPGKVVAVRRSFFGVHRVLEEKGYRTLVHGNTHHGRQSLIPSLKNRPLTYYYPTGPIGNVFTSQKYMSRISRIGMVGLGVGSLAAYLQPQHQTTIYEIDPEVIYLARDSGLFTFLKDSKGRLDYVLGDARLTVAKVPDGTFDLLVLDAFSSDSIPTHLLTLEAFQMFKRKMKPDGVIALHISNRYLDLATTVGLTSASAGLRPFDQVDGPSDAEAAEGKTQSHWTLLLQDTQVLQELYLGNSWGEIDDFGDAKIWTDESVNILSVYNPQQ